MLEKISTRIAQTLRRIRKAKHLTQTDLSPKNMARSTVSKNERAVQPILFTTMLYYLEKLQIDISEFMFICRDYNLSDSDQLINEFIEAVEQTDIGQLKDIQEGLDSYTQVNPYDWYLGMIHQFIEEILAHASKQISFEDYEDHLRELALSSWHKINSYDEWYLYEFRFLNYIAYYLPFHEVEIILNQIFIKFERYQDFPDFDSIYCAFVLNISGYYLMHAHRDKAYELLDENEQKILTRKNSDYRAILLVRKAIASENIADLKNLLDHLTYLTANSALQKKLKLEVVNFFPEFFTHHPSYIHSFDPQNFEKIGFSRFYWLIV